MPYNVICLACTVVAIAFGSLHNLTTRRFVAIDPEKKKKSNPLQKLKAFFTRKKEEQGAIVVAETVIDTADGVNDTDKQTDSKEMESTTTGADKSSTESARKRGKGDGTKVSDKKS